MFRGLCIQSAGAERNHYPYARMKERSHRQVILGHVTKASPSISFYFSGIYTLTTSVQWPPSCGCFLGLGRLALVVSPQSPCCLSVGPLRTLQRRFSALLIILCLLELPKQRLVGWPMESVLSAGAYHWAQAAERESFGRDVQIVSHLQIYIVIYPLKLAFIPRRYFLEKLNSVFEAVIDSQMSCYHPYSLDRTCDFSHSLIIKSIIKCKQSQVPPSGI